MRLCHRTFPKVLGSTCELQFIDLGRDDIQLVCVPVQEKLVATCFKLRWSQV